MAVFLYLGMARAIACKWLLLEIVLNDDCPWPVVQVVRQGAKWEPLDDLNSLIHWYTGRLYFAFWNRDVNSLALTTSNCRMETRRECGESSVPWQRWCLIHTHILQEGHTTSARWLMLLPQQKTRNLMPSRSKTNHKWLQPMRTNHGPSMLKAYNLQKTTVGLQ